MKSGYPHDLAGRMNRRKLPSLAAQQRDESIRRTIHLIPRGKVATYGQVAAAAGYPLLHRQVAKLLRDTTTLPWQRVVGSGGEIKLKQDMALEQRLRLEMEGVTFRGRRVNLDVHQYVFETWLDD